MTSESGWPGNGVRTYHRGYPNMQARVVRDWSLAGEGTYWNAYLGDTISFDRLTVNAGVRWDRSASSVLGASVPASPALPDLLPALEAPGIKNAIVYNNVTPRVGLTYALNESRKTIVRGSYAIFASQLDSNRAPLTVSAIPYYSYVYYAAVDTNGNRIADVSEFTTFQGVAGFDPNNPLGGNPDRIGNYSSPLTHELLFGVEHELLRNFGVAANVTWRRYTGFNWLNYPGVTGADFTQAGVFAGTAPGIGSYNVPYYHVNESALPADFGQLYETRSDYYQRYLGFEISATKRMADRWMMRLGFSTNDHREYLKGPGASEDPTPVFTTTDAYPNVDGGPVMTPSTGSGKSSIYMALPKYQFIANGAYQAKWGITFGGQLPDAPGLLGAVLHPLGYRWRRRRDRAREERAARQRRRQEPAADRAYPGRAREQEHHVSTVERQPRHGHLQPVQLLDGAGARLRPRLVGVRSGSRDRQPAHHPLWRQGGLLDHGQHG